MAVDGFSDGCVSLHHRPSGRQSRKVSQHGSGALGLLHGSLAGLFFPMFHTSGLRNALHRQRALQHALSFDGVRGIHGQFVFDSCCAGKVQSGFG